MRVRDACANYTLVRVNKSLLMAAREDEIKAVACQLCLESYHGRRSELCHNHPVHRGRLGGKNCAQTCE